MKSQKNTEKKLKRSNSLNGDKDLDNILSVLYDKILDIKNEDQILISLFNFFENDKLNLLNKMLNKVVRYKRNSSCGNGGKFVSLSGNLIAQFSIKKNFFANNDDYSAIFFKGKYRSNSLSNAENKKNIIEELTNAGYIVLVGKKVFMKQNENL